MEEAAVFRVFFGGKNGWFLGCATGVFYPQKQPVDNSLFPVDNPVDNFFKTTSNPTFLPGFSKVGFCFLINATKIFGFILCPFLRISPLCFVYGVGCAGGRASKGRFCEDLRGVVLGLGYGFCVAGGGVIPGNHVFLRLPWWERFSPILINVARLQYKILNTP